MNPRATSVRSALAGLIIVILAAMPQAQQPVQMVATPAVNTSAARTPADEPTDIDLLVGRSTIVNVGATIHRVSLTVPDIADALVTAPTQLLIHGKQPGTISLFVWDKGGTIKTYEVNVRRDLSALGAHLKQLFPGEPITVLGSGKDVVLSGKVSGQYVIDKAADVAGGYVEMKENVVNLLKQQEGVASNQVLLRVRFAEVSRNALQEAGVSLFADGREGRWGRTTTQQFAAPFFDQKAADLGKAATFTDYLNLFLFDTKEGLGAVVKALQSKGVFQSLAEPNLIALNGKEASFLAGGEFPIPVLQGNSNAVTIIFKEFGVRLNFTPTVLGGDLINLKLKPEVSALDFNNALIFEGFRIPALTSRRAETEVELRDGQTFAIAGLMNNSAVSSMRKVPGLGDIPILGLLFKSRAYQKDQTELVVMVTPHIVKRDSTGVSEGLPSIEEPYLGAPARPLPPPAPYVGSPRYPADRSRKSNTSAATRPQVLQPADDPVAQPAQPQAAPKTQATATQPPTVTSQPAAAEPPTPTKEELKALDRAEEQRRKEAEAAAKAKAAEDKQIAKEQAAAAKKAEKAAKEQGKRDAEAAKKAAEISRRQAEEQQKRDKALADAAARLKAAQAAYQAEIAKTKSGGQ